MNWSRTTNKVNGAKGGKETLSLLWLLTSPRADGIMVKVVAKG